MKATLVLLVFAVCAVSCLPLELENELSKPQFGQSRFVDYPSDYPLADPRLRRARRGAEDCEKLQLCKLHARSQRNFFAAFELYFVNKENARLWDHQTHTVGDCYRRYSCYR